MRIFVDIDGTLTKHQRRNADAWPEMVERVQAWQDAGHEVVLWSGNTRYARRMAKRLGLSPNVAVGKPDIIVDNQRAKWGGRLLCRTITPEQFLALNIGGQT